MKKLLNIVLAFTMVVFFTSCSDQNTNPVDPSSSETVNKVALALSPGDLSEDEEASLIFMRQEEKLLRDVYTVLGSTWNMQVFNLLKQSEQRHMDAIKRLLTKYEVPDPIISDEVGIFDNPQFQQLFDDYVAQGLTSRLEALLVGQTMEQEDIAAIESGLEFIDNSDIINVYTNLLAAAGKHSVALSSHSIGQVQ